MKYKYYLLVVFLIGFSTCVPYVEEPLTEVNIDFSDPLYQKIYNFQDSQQLDSLLHFATHRDPSYRYAVANAFASFKDPKAIEPLVDLLNDSIRQVQHAAAFALGQIGDPRAEQALIEAFIRKDTASVDNKLNNIILEAVGKCGSEETLRALSSVSSYRKQDENLLLGQANGIYQYGLRGIIAEEGTNTMIDLVTNQEYPVEARVVAANYLQRFPDADISNAVFRLSKVLQEEEDARIRMAVALTLGRTNEGQVLPILLQQLDKDSDYRVKCNILRSLGNYSYISVIQKILNTLNHSNLHVAKSAADYLYNYGNGTDAPIYLDYARRNVAGIIKARIYEAVLKHLPISYTNSRNRVLNEVKRQIERTDDPYEKAAYINAIAQDLRNYRMLRDLGFSNQYAPVRTASVGGFNKVLGNENWSRVYRSRASSKRAKIEIAQMLREAMESGDIAMIAEAANILSYEEYDFKNTIASPDYLTSVREDLLLPRDIEAFMAIENAIKYFNSDFKIKTTAIGFNHPIDWTYLKGISDSTRAIIITDKGELELQFYTQEAPGTVTNFIQLAKEDFYDGKLFHRVVPTFVIQGGCTRGDGYGSPDFTIRSELSPINYDVEGRVGMASAGNHTESAQFFITHAPAMHLNGRYTIFAQVTQGMDVVHNIQMGDKIVDIKIN